MRQGYRGVALLAATLLFVGSASVVSMELAPVSQALTPQNSYLSVSEVSAEVGTMVSATATLFDFDSNRLPGYEVTFGVTNEGWLSSPTCTTDGNGQCSVFVTTNRAGPTEVRATVVSGGVPIDLAFSPTVIDFYPHWVTPSVYIPDPALLACINETVGQNAIDLVDYNQALNVMSLDCRSRGIADLTGLEAFVNLTSLNLDYNEIFSVAPLSGLSQLSVLHVDGNHIVDLSPLSGIAVDVYAHGQTITLPDADAGVLYPLPFIDQHGEFSTIVISTPDLDVVRYPSSPWILYTRSGSHTFWWSTSLESDGTTPGFSGVANQWATAGLAEPDLAASTLTVSTDADGVGHAEARVVDSFDQPIEGVQVTFLADSVGAVDGWVWVTKATDSLGLASAKVTSATQCGWVDVTVNAVIGVNGAAFDLMGSPATVKTFKKCEPVVIEPDPAQSYLSVTASNVDIACDGSYSRPQATITVRDEAGDPVAGAEVRFTGVRDLTGTWATPWTTGSDGSFTVPVFGANSRYLNPVSVQAWVLVGGDWVEVSGSPTVVKYNISHQCTISISSANASSVYGSAFDWSVESVTVYGESGQVLCESGMNIWVADDFANGISTSGKDWWCYAPSGTVSQPITVVAFDKDGNAVGLPMAWYLDTDVPTAPIVEVANATQISGHAEPGLLMEVYVPSSNRYSTIIVTAADNEGNWSVPTPPNSVNGALTIIGRDEAGNPAPRVEMNVCLTDSCDTPYQPTVRTANASTIAGASPYGVTVVVRDLDGAEICRTSPGYTANWTCDYLGAVVSGPIFVVAIDADGNESVPTPYYLDADAPEAPVILSVSFRSISGTGEPGATVYVSFPSQGYPGFSGASATVAADGTWSVDPVGIYLATPADFARVQAHARDAAGNSSALSSPVSCVSPVSCTLPSGTQVLTPSQPADGISVNTVRAGIFDNFGNAVPGGKVVFTVLSGGAFPATQTCTIGADGTCDANFTSLTEGDSVIRVSLDGAIGIELGGSPVTISFTEIPHGDPGIAISSLTSGYVTVVPAMCSEETRWYLDGWQTAAEFAVMDVFGNLLPGVEVSFEVGYPFAPKTQTVLTDANGMASTQLVWAEGADKVGGWSGWSGGGAPSVDVTATIGYLDWTSQATSQVSIGEVVIDPILWNGTATATTTGSVEADGVAAHQVEVSTFNYCNVPASAQVYVWVEGSAQVTSPSDTLTPSVFSNPYTGTKVEGWTLATGSDAFAVLLVTDPVAETATVHVAVEDIWSLSPAPLTGSPLALTFEAPWIDPRSGMSLVTTPVENEYGHVVDATAWIRDIYGNPISGEPVTFTVGNEGDFVGVEWPAVIPLVKSVVVLTDADGYASVQVKSSTDCTWADVSVAAAIERGAGFFGDSDGGFFDIPGSPTTVSVFSISPSCPNYVYMPDPVLREIVNGYLGQDAAANITFEQALTVSNITDFSARRVSDLTGLEAFTNLSSLAFSSSDVSDVSALTGLTKLSSLMLVQSNISDLTPLTGLTNMVYLTLSGNPIADLTPLSGLVKLTNLDLANYDSPGHGLISDLGPLSGLTNLLMFNGTNNVISDLTPLGGLTSLKLLYVDRNQISDLSPVSGLASLERLDARDNQISDISPVGGLSRLGNLALNGNQISDVTAVGSLPSLTSLSLGRNQISDWSPLASLTQLSWLDISSNGVSDLTDLSGLSSLTGLLATGNHITDLSPLATTGVGYYVSAYSQTATLPAKTAGVAYPLPIVDSAGVSLVPGSDGSLYISGGDYTVDEAAGTITFNTAATYSLYWNANVPCSDCSFTNGYFSGTATQVVNPSPDLVYMPDPVLREIVNGYLGQDAAADITFEQALTLIEISNPSDRSSDKRVTDLTGLEAFTNLTTLLLPANDISDLTPLAGLAKLRSLNFDVNVISDLGPLAGLPNLAWLALYGNDISDLSPLSGLTNLWSLNLGDNPVSDLAPL
ncbi:MAG: Ig-like domain-containing protein, partial [Propionibacteriaceae bacterium]|nr:Ig-like domain-containing protein [Propionibacteriaceae bacterium]